MSLDYISQLLSCYHPAYAEENVYKQHMLDFIRLHPDALLRSCHLGQFTASCWLVNLSVSHTLLMHHVKHDCWLQPGGHADGDHRLLHVAKKEAVEESGLSSIKVVDEGIFDLDIHLIPPYKGVASHYHFDVRFLMQADSEEPVCHNDESHAMHWVALSDVETYNNERSLLRMRDKSLSEFGCG